jgi:hypothetical protein
MGETLNLCRISNRIILVQYMIQLVRVFEAMIPLIPENVPMLGAVFKRGRSGEYSEIVFLSDCVEKTLKPNSNCDFETLTTLYKLVKEGRVLNTIQCRDRYPRVLK